jgi:hypothetical protein
MAMHLFTPYACTDRFPELGFREGGPRTLDPGVGQVEGTEETCEISVSVRDHNYVLEVLAPLTAVTAPGTRWNIMI